MDKARHGSPTLPVFLPGQRRPSVPAADDEVIREDFARYYQQHMPGLIRFVMRYGAGPYEAADAAQAAFIEAFRAWHLIQSPAAWLRKVAFRQYLRQAPVPEEELTDDVPDRPAFSCPLDKVVLQEEEKRVYAALAQLSMRQRQVMAWHLDGFTTSEIAAELGMQPHAVRQNLARARAQLKDLLGLNSGGAQ
ncbi:sigma-70 family RNA polymerase sigma factor [Streptomyces sp. NBS 14/10]|uniref:sigma-70 family RNA polymerase sigma factor n=1 Tax=Streptomyces sp. NBS 14/10 TaxID=1945643 RepID=UPI00211AB429|nr:sigma-70 family RNA polymerase sigma factor [Streptomyces sp. NBS 14/10]KAK1177949.1 sigma-70 family RNA polymerase sigma factor [Streptomyces sp. NBS 14/10]